MDEMIRKQDLLAASHYLWGRARDWILDLWVDELPLIVVLDMESIQRVNRDHDRDLLCLVLALTDEKTSRILVSDFYVHALPQAGRRLSRDARREARTIERIRQCHRLARGLGPIHPDLVEEVKAEPWWHASNAAWLAGPSSELLWQLGHTREVLLVPAEEREPLPMVEIDEEGGS